MAVLGIAIGVISRGGEISSRQPADPPCRSPTVTGMYFEVLDD